MYTMGLKESDDISKIIDTMLEENPDHSFGIYAKGNSANVALKAMEKDKRIRYGIVENYFPTLEDHLLYMNYDDLIYSQKYLNKYILKNTLDYLDTSIDEVSIHPDRINQPILMLSTPYNYEAMSVLHDTVNSADKYLMLFEENILLKTGYKGADEGLLNCLTEFIEMYSNEAKEYIHDEIFQPS